MKAKAENITRSEAVERIRREINESQSVFEDDIVTRERLFQYRQKANEILSDHWDIFLKQYLLSQFLILIDPDRFTLDAVLYEQPSEGFFNRIGDIGGIVNRLTELIRQKEIIMFLFLNFLLLLLTIAGMAITVFRIRQYPKQSTVIVILLLIIVFHIAMTGLTPWARFRVMFHPLIALLAAPGVLGILMYVKETVYKKFRADRGNIG